MHPYALGARRHRGRCIEPHGLASLPYRRVLALSLSGDDRAVVWIRKLRAPFGTNKNHQLAMRIVNGRSVARSFVSFHGRAGPLSRKLRKGTQSQHDGVLLTLVGEARVATRLAGHYFSLGSVKEVRDAESKCLPCVPCVMRVGL